MKNLIKLFVIILLVLNFISCKKATLPQLSTVNVTGITYTTAVASGNVTADGGASIISRGICWSTSPDPTLTGNKTTVGGTTGEYTGNLTQLAPNTTYYLRAFATNSEGTAFGNQLTFKTLATEVPELTTVAVTGISRIAAVSGGIITDENGSPVIARGVCWSKTSNPVITDNKTSDGLGTGSFSSTLTGLKGGVTYYLRAYATNNVGTSYGNTVQFTTLAPDLPSITTKAVTSVLTTSVTSGGIVTNDGQGEVEKGVCWSVNPNPSTSDNVLIDQSQTMDFTSGVTGLNRNTTYYIRSFARNAAGTVYGAEFSFKTYGAIDGSNNKYYSIVLGDEEWIQANLRSTKYANGDDIPTTTPYDKDIVFETTPKYQWPVDGDDSKVEAYGRLYTWFTVADSRNICPAGWHVATNADWTNLENYLIGNGYNFDGTTDGNRIAKAMASLTGWLPDPTPGAIGNASYPEYRNKSGFGAYPSGYRLSDGLFNECGIVAFWWTSTEYDEVSVWMRELGYNSITMYSSDIFKLEQALPVRCVKD